MLAAGAKLDFASSADADLAPFTRACPRRRPPARSLIRQSSRTASSSSRGKTARPSSIPASTRTPAANPPIRGFTFAYPASQTAYLDRVAIAIANSFEPFPEAGAAPRRERSGQAIAPPAPSASRPRPLPPPAATALIVAPGKALTALKTSDCPNPSVAGKPVRIERADAETGLAMIAGDFASNRRSPALGAPVQDLVILGFAGPRLAASSASFAGDGARPVVTAAVDKSASGGPCSIGAGRSSALWRQSRTSPGASPASRSPLRTPLIAPDALRAFLGGGEPAAEEAASTQRGRYRRPREAGACRRLLPEINAAWRAPLVRDNRDHPGEDILLQRD